MVEGHANRIKMLKRQTFGRASIALLAKPVQLTIDVENWAEIRRLHRAEQMPIPAIARRLGISWDTVRRALKSEEAPKYQREPEGSIVDAVEPPIRELLQRFPERSGQYRTGCPRPFPQPEMETSR
jgi:transposase